MAANSGWWERLPEPVRWVLFLPALFLGILLVSLVAGLLQWLRGGSGFFIETAHAAFIAWFFFPMAIALAPRAKVAVGWVLYVPVTTLIAVSLLLMIGRALGLAGLLPFLPPPPGVAEWTSSDTADVGRAVAWLVVGTASFLNAKTEAAAATVAPR